MEKRILIYILSIFFMTNSIFAAEKFTPPDKTPESVMAYVDKAIQSVLKNGDKFAFAKLTDAKGPWVDGNWYIYINSYDGYVLAHLNKKLVGKNLLGTRDVKGNPFYAELQRAAQSKKKQGWVEFWWPKANSSIPARKLGFVKSVPGRRIWVGTGLYDMSDEDIKRVLNKK